MSARVSSGLDSKQDYGTPWPFIRAVEARWGALTLDLAAREDNAKAPAYITPEQDSLTSVWVPFGRQWLNPPFARITPWAAKCAASELLADARRFLLVPASVGSNWFASHVHRKALVLGLNGPRLQFEGSPDPYPKDLMLVCYGESPGFDVWRWR